MKTGKRSYPLDMLSVSEDGVSVSIHTHRQLIEISVDDGKEEWRTSITFDELVSLLMSQHKMPSSIAPSMMKGSRKSERSRSTGVEEGK